MLQYQIQYGKDRLNTNHSITSAILGLAMKLPGRGEHTDWHSVESVFISFVVLFSLQSLIYTLRRFNLMLLGTHTSCLFLRRVTHC